MLSVFIRRRRRRSYVSPARGIYKCFGCGKGGNAVTFLMEHESMTYPEALKAVAKRYGIEVKERELTPEEERRNDDRESMFALNGWAASYFADYLHREGEGMSVGMSYFRQTRGMTDATIRKFGLGFCPANGRPHVARRPGGGLQKKSFSSPPDYRSSANTTAPYETASTTA